MALKSTLLYLTDRIKHIEEEVCVFKFWSEEMDVDLFFNKVVK